MELTVTIKPRKSEIIHFDYNICTHLRTLILKTLKYIHTKLRSKK